jgi:molybdopterin-guanine dinucleotide biosynthesis protein A
MQTGGVVLCGGRSSRMGQPKALLPFGAETLLQRVVRILQEAVDPIVVVAAAGQELPPLPAAVRIVWDEQEYAGPLAGMGLGLRAIAADADAAYVSACDVPLLRTEFVRAMIDALGEHDAAVPIDGKFYHPLAGVYRTALVPQIAALVGDGRLRPLFLIESIRTAAVRLDDLRAVDGALDSLRNLNTLDDYHAALRDGGISAEPH